MAGPVTQVLFATNPAMPAQGVLRELSGHPGPVEDNGSLQRVRTTRRVGGPTGALAYETRGLASHTVDAAFLEAWLRHPEFHMLG